MAKKIILGRTYITSFGTEFTPIEKVSGRSRRISIGNPNSVGQLKECSFLDAAGNKIRKNKLKTLKK